VSAANGQTVGRKGLVAILLRIIWFVRLCGLDCGGNPADSPRHRAGRGIGAESPVFAKQKCVHKNPLFIRGEGFIPRGLPRL
jgi:hypothetical protein